jgi:hypothetical protein
MESKGVCIVRRILYLLTLGLTLTPCSTVAADDGAILSLFMPDGQLRSHPVRVYITQDILPSQNPQLKLLRSHALTAKPESESKWTRPVLVAPGQTWIERVKGEEVARTGTVLLFDLIGQDLQFKPMVRVVPIVSWSDGGMEKVVIGSEAVNLGNIVAIVGWTVLVVGVALLLIAILSWRSMGSPLQLLTGVDGHLSLSQTQVACWTMVVGGVVLGYGMLRLEVPEIPASLLVLMGASLVTGGVGYFQDAKKLQKAAVRGGETPARSTPELGNLLRVFSTGTPPELSLAKAQMLFWTLLLIVLFVSKSIVNGVIWGVPWPLVALMGFSQAGYLAPKIAPDLAE